MPRSGITCGDSVFASALLLYLPCSHGRSHVACNIVQHPHHEKYRKIFVTMQFCKSEDIDMGDSAMIINIF